MRDAASRRRAVPRSLSRRSLRLRRGACEAAFAEAGAARAFTAAEVQALARRAQGGETEATAPAAQPVVQLRHMLQSIRKAFSSPHEAAVRALPQQGQLLLGAAVLLAKHRATGLTLRMVRRRSDPRAGPRATVY